MGIFDIILQTLSQEMPKHCLTTQLDRQRSFPSKKATLSGYLNGLILIGGMGRSTERMALYLPSTSASLQTTTLT